MLLLFCALCGLWFAACGERDDHDDMVTPSPGDAANDDGAPHDDGAAAMHDEDVDNVAACEDLAVDLACGGFDLGQALACDTMASYPCDLADYFECLAESFTCEGDVPDVSGLMDCVSLLDCG